MNSRIAHNAPTATPTTTPAPGGLLVDFDSVLGQDCQPLSKVNPGATVTATVTIRHLASARGGRVRGILAGSGGQAIFTVDSDSYSRLWPVLGEGLKVMVRGTVTIVGQVPTIAVFAAREVHR